MTHPENRFEPGDFVIHRGPSARGDWSFVHGISRVIEDTEDFLTVEKPVAYICGGLSKFTLWRGEYPDWARATSAQIDAERKMFEEYERLEKGGV